MRLWALAFSIGVLHQRLAGVVDGRRLQSPTVYLQTNATAESQLQADTASRELKSRHSVVGYAAGPLEVFVSLLTSINSAIAFFPSAILRPGVRAEGLQWQPRSLLGVSRTGLVESRPRDEAAERLEPKHSGQSRRDMLRSVACAAILAGSTLVTAPVQAVADSAVAPADARLLNWVAKDSVYPGAEKVMEVFYCLEFVTYFSRILLNYDKDCSAWWDKKSLDLSQLPVEDQAAKRRSLFASFSASVEYGLRRYPGVNGPPDLLKSVSETLGSGLDGKSGVDIDRQLAIAFSLLDEKIQPVSGIEKLLTRVPKPTGEIGGGDVSVLLGPLYAKMLPEYMAKDEKRLLPATQIPVKTERGFYEVQGIGKVLDESRKYRVRFGRAQETVFGPRGELASKAMDKGAREFSLFALAGAVGCAGTHSAVIPLDVVKTRLQTEPGRYDSISDGFGRIFDEEGLAGLFLGTSPTLLGYVFYGATVYPGFELFEQIFDNALGPTLAASLHAPVVLLGGACATVVACFGVCPAEVFRIRMVSKPAQYGNGNDMIAALSVVQKEATAAGVSLVEFLYSGFRPLLVRQVIFGMIKFFTFDSCVDAILTAFPQLSGSTNTELLVSLGAGLVAGVVSSLVSQPADTVLSRMNRGSDDLGAGVKKKGVIETVQDILEEFGPTGLYYGARARVLWSGSIISGQFFFYDFAKRLLSVSSNDLALLLDVNL